MVSKGVVTTYMNALCPVCIGHFYFIEVCKSQRTELIAAVIE